MRDLIALVLLLAGGGACAAPADVDPSSIEGKVMCGYQGWFRCPGDAEGTGWGHWSRERGRIAPETLTFEMWPDVSDYAPAERFPAPGFTHADGAQAYLYSSDNAATVLRHFEWMRDYGIDGAWLQRFLVGLPGGPIKDGHASRARVLEHVRRAAARTGRVWCLSYDIAAMPADRIYDTLTADWKRLVEAGVPDDPRYLHQGGRPVVQIWGFYYGNKHNLMSPELGSRLIQFFRAPGRTSAFLIGGGDWDWRRNPDPAWRAMVARLDGYAPWNVGNYSLDKEGGKHATTNTWAGDIKECAARGTFWLPVVYPGFGWDNLTRQPAGSSTIPRRSGRFFWEQFHALAKLGVRSAYIAMFDEVDEGTAIYKVTSAPPTQAHFIGFEGLPSDWYLRLAGEGARMLRGERPLSEEIPIRP